MQFSRFHKYSRYALQNRCENTKIGMKISFGRNWLTTDKAINICNLASAQQNAADVQSLTWGSEYKARVSELYDVSQVCRHLSRHLSLSTSPLFWLYLWLYIALLVVCLLSRFSIEQMKFVFDHHVNRTLHEWKTVQLMIKFLNSIISPAELTKTDNMIKPPAVIHANTCKDKKKYKNGCAVMLLNDKYWIIRW